MHNIVWMVMSSRNNKEQFLCQNPTADDLPRKTQLKRTLATRVLVIDDDNATTDLFKLILKPNEFEVHVANSGPEGIDATHRLSPDVVVLDLLMPQMDGSDVCRAIRSFSQVPILVLSAVSKPGMVAQALDEGADDYLLKPITSSVLIARLKRLVWRARAESEANENNLNLFQTS
jgi:two-component system response regulator RegX3